jgi:hypothetical protein
MEVGDHAAGSLLEECRNYGMDQRCTGGGKECQGEACGEASVLEVAFIDFCGVLEKQAGDHGGTPSVLSLYLMARALCFPKDAFGSGIL